jgi:molecular chaperone DnaJ
LSTKSKRDYYEVLGVAKSASGDDIKKAFREKARRLHPNSGGDEDTFKELAEAYAVLQDAKQRAAYDRHQLDSQPD